MNKTEIKTARTPRERAQALAFGPWVDRQELARAIEGALRGQPILSNADSEIATRLAPRLAA